MSTRRTLLITSLIAAVGAALVVPNAAFSRGTPESSMNNFTNYITSNMIKNNSITSNDIKNLSIKVDDLSNRIITNEKIIPGAVKLDTLDAEVMAKVQTMIDATVAAKIASLSIPAAPRAYGRVKADGSVDASVSSGLSARKSGNKYCVSVTGVTDPTKITPVVTASNNSIAAYAVVTSLANCNSNEFGVGVYFSSVDEAAPFNVYVP